MHRLIDDKKNVLSGAPTLNTDFEGCEPYHCTLSAGQSYLFTQARSWRSAPILWNNASKYHIIIHVYVILLLVGLLPGSQPYFQMIITCRNSISLR